MRLSSRLPVTVVISDVAIAPASKRPEKGYIRAARARRWRTDNFLDANRPEADADTLTWMELGKSSCLGLRLPFADVRLSAAISSRILA